MTSYAITAGAIEHYRMRLARLSTCWADSLARKLSERPTVSWKPWCKWREASCCAG